MYMIGDRQNINIFNLIDFKLINKYKFNGIDYYYDINKSL